MDQTDMRDADNNRDLGGSPDQVANIADGNDGTDSATGVDGSASTASADTAHTSSAGSPHAPLNAESRLPLLLDLSNETHTPRVSESRHAAAAGNFVEKQDKPPLVLTPKGPRLARVRTSAVGVHMAQYSNVDVLEIELGDITVMRRVSDGAINATQLLKLAGLDRSRRQKVLDRQVGGAFEKVQGGTGKYQGTWVPLTTARDLAKQYGIDDSLQPLLTFDITQARALPTQEDIAQHRAELAKHTEKNPMAAAAAASAAGAAGAVAGNAGAGDLPPSKLAAGFDSGLKPQINQAVAIESEDLQTLQPLDPPEGDSLAELSRDIVTELFLSANRGETRALTDILDSHDAPEIEPDVPIDEAGHTALHWASALGKVALVADLVSHGANCRRGNRRGESPLVRAVLVTNSSDTQTFGQLLDILFPCLHLGDAQGRTVLHHIALTAGIPGRSAASRYYLDALLEWAVRCRGSSGVQWLVDELVNAQDANGDTALNIAARLGSKQIAQQLLDIGAAVELPNRAGLRPADFGISIPKSVGGSNDVGVNNSSNNSGADSNAGVDGNVGTDGADGTDGIKNGAKGNAGGAMSNGSRRGSTVPERNGSRVPLDNGEKRQELRQHVLSAISQLDEHFQSELAAKDATLQSLHTQLREANNKLESLTTRKREVDDRKGRLIRARKRLAALEAAASSEASQFDAESERLGQMPAPTTPTEFDADQPFRISDEEELKRMPPALLRARIAAYRQNEKQLLQLRDELRNSSLEGEAKYRRVVAQCTSNDESKVDDMLEDLMLAVTKGDTIEDRSSVKPELRKLMT